MAAYRLLLIKSDTDFSWVSTLKNAMRGQAEVTIAKEDELLQEIQKTRYDLILINTASMIDVVKVLQTIKKAVPGIPAVVVTAVPDPEIARSVFLAGAADYIFQSMDEKEIRNDLLGIIKMTKRG